MRTVLTLRRVLRVFFALTATVCLSLAALASGACSADVLRLRVKYYLVYCAVQPSADGVSAVKGEGGAGFILHYGGKEYVVATCHHLSGEARANADSFTRRGLKSDVLTISMHKFRLETFNASQNAALYESNLKSLNELALGLSDVVAMAESANSEGERSAMRSCFDKLTSLLGANRANCFTSPLARLIALTADCAYSHIVLAREVRYLQAAVINAIINIRLS